MNLAVRALGLLLGFSVFSSQVYAHVGFSCEALLVGERAVTVKILKDKSAQSASEKEKIVGKPSFEHLLQQSGVEQVGEKGPRAFADVYAGQGISFISTPAPTSSDSIAVDLFEEGRSVALHVDTNWQGRRSSTAAFVNLPLPKILNNSRYIVGTEYPVVLVHLHGGGTPTATGRNGMSIAKEIGKRGIPTIAFDLPGHGRATRNPNDLETFYKQAEWVLQIIEQLVDPRVKVVLSGHSWGAQFAVFMRRLALDPKYKERVARISRFIALAPPVDVSLKGDNQASMEFEREYEKNFDKYEKQIAAADFEFGKNLLSNGKNSDIGGYFLSMTNMDYVTRPLSAAEEAQLAPETVVIGHADSLYVGREEQFAQAFGKNLIVLPAGRTWQSKKNDPNDVRFTGHNLFDRYIDGTENLQVYRMIGDLVLNGGPDLSVSETTGDKAKDLVDRMFRHYANFFGFREMLTHPEYVTQDTDVRRGYSVRRGELQAYIDRVTPMEAEIAKLNDPDAQIPQVQKSIEVLRQRIGLTDKLNSKRAKEDLALPPLTPERRKMLEDYIEGVRNIEADLKVTFKDSSYEVEIQQLDKEFAKLIEHLKIKSVADYFPAFKAMDMRKKGGDDAWVRADLGRLHQRMIDANERRQQNFGLARNARISKLVVPDGVKDMRSAKRELEADRSPEHQAKLREFIAQYDKEDQQARAGLIAQVKQRLEHEKRPDGVAGVAAAIKERDTIESRLNSTYTPDGHEEIGIIARQIKAYQQEVDTLSKGDDQTSSLESVENAVKDLRSKRAQLLKRWEGFWRGGEITSSNIQRADQNMKSTLENYKELYYAYEAQKGDWLLQLKNGGHLNGTNILKSTPALERLRVKVLQAKQVYMQNRHEFETLRWTEAIKGRLQGPEDIIRKATALAREIWGDNYSSTGRAGVNSVTHSLRFEEEYLANRQAQLSLKERQLGMLRVEYGTRMRNLGQSIPSVVIRVDLGKALEQSLPDLLKQLESDPALFQAYQQALSRWEGYLGRMRAENQTKDRDSGGY